MMKIKTGVLSPKVRHVSDEEYPAVLKSMIAHCKERCYCSIFIVDFSPSKDREHLVDSVLLGLQAALWRGTDVRLLIGGSRTNFEIAQIGLAAKSRADQLNIPCRLMESMDVRGSHVKMVIADNFILAGSHNWSGGAFTNQTQDSILIDSPDMAAGLTATFKYQWSRLENTKEEGEKNGSV